MVQSHLALLAHRHCHVARDCPCFLWVLHVLRVLFLQEFHLCLLAQVLLLFPQALGVQLVPHRLEVLQVPSHLDFPDYLPVRAPQGILDFQQGQVSLLLQHFQLNQELQGDRLRRGVREGLEFPADLLYLDFQGHHSHLGVLLGPDLQLGLTRQVFPYLLVVQVGRVVHQVRHVLGVQLHPCFLQVQSNLGVQVVPGVPARPDFHCCHHSQAVLFLLAHHHYLVFQVILLGLCCLRDPVVLRHR